MFSKRFNEAVFAVLFFRVVEGFGNPVRVERECVSSKQLPFSYEAIPLLEESEHSRCGIEPINSTIAPKQKRTEMATIRVAQAPRSIVIFAKEERGVCAISSVLVKELVHGSQESLRLI